MVKRFIRKQVTNYKIYTLIRQQFLEKKIGRQIRVKIQYSCVPERGVRGHPPPRRALSCVSESVSGDRRESMALQVQQVLVLKIQRSRLVGEVLIVPLVKH